MSLIPEWTKIGSGSTAGHVLTSNGANSQPSFQAASGGEGLETGAIVYFADADSPPSSDWIKCDGSVYDQSAYPALFNQLGTIPDGFDWENSNGPTSADINGGAFNNGYFVQVGANGLIRNSPDGINWTAQTSGTSTTFHDAVAGLTIFLACGGNGIVYTSGGNGSTWGPKTSQTTSNLFAAGFSDRDSLWLVAGAGGVISTSLGATNWILRNSGTTSTIYSIKFLNDHYIYVGAGGAMGTSTDGITWNTLSSGTASTIRDIAYGNGMYVYVGDLGLCATSPDSENWTPRAMQSASDLESVTFVDGMFIQTGTQGTVRTSINGVDWTQRPSGTANQINSLVAGEISGEKLYVCLGNSGLGRTFSKRYSYNTATEFLVPDLSPLGSDYDLPFPNNAYIKS